jgi:hypothetical protein
VRCIASLCQTRWGATARAADRGWCLAVMSLETRLRWQQTRLMQSLTEWLRCRQWKQRPATSAGDGLR